MPTPLSARALSYKTAESQGLAASRTKKFSPPADGQSRLKGVLHSSATQSPKRLPKKLSSVLGKFKGLLTLDEMSALTDAISRTVVVCDALTHIAEAWQLSDAEAAGLLDVDEASWQQIRKGRWQGSFGEDQLLRASALIGIYESLQVAFGGTLADHWVKIQNKHAVFGGKRPIEAMMAGGLPTILETRRHLDTASVGL